MNPVHTITPYLLSLILILPSHLCLCSLSDLFPSGFVSRILYEFFISPIDATHPANPILDLIAIIICGEEYSLWSSPLCSFHHFAEYNI